jgi:S1-C subfamily serine protease
MPVEWWIRRDRNVSGPFSARQIEDLARDLELPEETELRLGRTTQWTPAGELKWLDEFFHVAEEVEEVDPEPEEPVPAEGEVPQMAPTGYEDASVPEPIPVEAKAPRKRLSKSVVTLATWGLFALSLIAVVTVAVLVFSGDEDTATSNEDGEEPADDDDDTNTAGTEDGVPGNVITEVTDEIRASQAIGLVASGWHGIDEDGDLFDRQTMFLSYDEDDIGSLSPDVLENLIPVSSPRGRFYVEAVLGGTGTCFLISPDGVAITNKHVIDDFARVQRSSGKRAKLERVHNLEDLDPRLWVFLNGQPHEARVVHESSSFDMAILKIDGISNSPYFRLHSGSDLPRGTKVWAMGFPAASRGAISEEEDFDAYRRLLSPNIDLWFKDSDFAYSLTEGSVSVVSDRTGFGTAIQHTADVNPGNSGGPLMMENGCVVGINTLYFKSTAGMMLSLSMSDLNIRQEIKGVNQNLIWDDKP